MKGQSSLRRQAKFSWRILCSNQTDNFRPSVPTEDPVAYNDVEQLKRRLTGENKSTCVYSMEGAFASS